MLSPRRADGCLHIFDFFGRRQDRLHRQGFDPEFARPSSRVIQVFVLIVFDSIMSRLKDGLCTPNEAYMKALDKSRFEHLKGKLKKEDELFGNAITTTMKSAPMK